MNEEKKKLVESSSEIIGELVIDNQLTEGFIKEIPIVKSIWTFYKTGKSIQEFFYLRKLKTFLENIQDINEIDYQEFIEFIKETETNKEKLTNSILLILDKVEDETKAILIASAFKLYVRERFCYETFNRLLLIINRGFCSDLLSIIAFEKHEELITNEKYIKSESLSELFSCGLLKNVDIDGGSANGDGGIVYSLNEYGKIFLRIVKRMN